MTKTGTLREAMKWCGYVHLSGPISSFKPDCAKCWAQVEAALAATADSPEGPYGTKPHGSRWVVTRQNDFQGQFYGTQLECEGVRDVLNRLHTKGNNEK